MSALAPLREAARALASARLDELSLATPWSLLLLFALVPLVWRLFARRRPALVFSRGEALAKLPLGAGHVLSVLSRALFALAVTLSLVALSGPRAPGEPDPESLEGIDIVVVLDVSGSMRAADFKPRDRLYVAKQVIARHLLPRERDRIGLVVFAGEAFTQAPLTHDKRLLGEILDGVRTGVITDGTAIGDAVATGVNRLRDSDAKSRVLILVTDGDNNAGNIAPEKAAELAKEFGVRIYPILVGRGGRVPYPSGGRDVLGMPSYGYASFPTNPELLQKMAATSGGTFFNAEDPASLAGSLQTILESLDKSRLESGPPVRRPVDLSPLLLLPAALLLALGLVLAVTRGSTVP